MTLTVHHLHASASERVVWLCEELDIPYTLATYTRAPLLAPPAYKALHPSGSSPVIQDDSDSYTAAAGRSPSTVTLAESGACVEYISRRHGSSKLFLDPTDAAYPDFMYWWHWSNASFQASLGKALMARAMGVGGSSDGTASSSSVGSSNSNSNSAAIVKVFQSRVQSTLAALESRLQDNEWLAGGEFTAADIMVVFSLTTFRYFYPYSLAEYGNVLAYLQRVSHREGYQRAMKKADPDMELALGAEPPREFGQ